jgi:type IV pilus assembly protein PilB
VEAARNPWPALGTLLVRDGVISAEQLEFALAAKRRSPELRLGEILVEHGYCTPTEIATVLAEQHELPYLTVTLDTIDLEAASLLPEALARRYCAVPVRFDEEGAVLVAVADPTNVLFSDELRLALGVPVKVGVSTRDAIEIAIERIHEGATFEVTGVDEDEDAADDSTDIEGDHETPAVLFVNRSIAKALDMRASDIHFTPQNRRVQVRARIDGVLREISSISGSHTSAVVSRLKIMAGLDIAERRAPQDGRVAVRRGGQAIDVRVAVLPTTNGEKVTLRLLNQSGVPASLDDLGLWPRNRTALEHAIRQPYGAVMVVGPTGSGKTTTLYACLQELNEPDVSIVTIEDPVEYRLGGLDQIDINPRAGLTFATGLRTILRSDPDIVLVGEIRDEETAEIAFRAAMTGHLVLSTLHAQTASAALQRLLDIDVDRSIIASSVNAFVAQRLVRTLCTHCREPYTADADQLRDLGVPDAVSQVTLHRAVGCRECSDIGYRGRTAVFEVLPMTDAIASMVGASSREVEAMAVAEGMLTLREDGVRLAIAGVTTIEEVRRVVGSLGGH